MKKEIFAALLLLLLLLCSGLNSHFYKKESCELGRIISFSGRFAAEGDREKALTELSTAYGRFRNKKSRLSLLSGEEPIQNIESLFLLLRSELGENRLSRCSALYAALLGALEELSQAQSLKLETIF